MPLIRGFYSKLTTDEILAEIGQERELQFQRWGQQDHIPLEWVAILTEETGEVAKATIEWIRRGDSGSSQYRCELIQTAAVAVAAIEAFDRSESA